MKNNKYKVGQTVWVRPQIKRIDDVIVEHTIIRIRNKYIEVDGSLRRRFDIETGLEHDIGFKGKIFLSLEEAESYD